MSNYRAIATVTATLRHLLQQVEDDVEGVSIIAKPPDVAGAQLDGDAALNIFLYQIMHNEGYKNMDLPLRGKDGKLIRKSVLGLNLNYLITAYTKDNDFLKAQQILASAMRTLHENAILNSDMIRETEMELTEGWNSGLAEQIESIKLTPNPLSLEELTKLWSSFFQTPYRLSVSYQATVVLLEGKKEPRVVLPVHDRLFYTAPFKQPVIESVEPQILEKTSAATLVIKGRNLKADKVTVRFDALEPVEPEPNAISDKRVSVKIPDNLTAGIRSVQVIHELMLGSPPSPHKGYESNILAFVLTPKIVSKPDKVSRGNELTINFKPAVRKDQKVVFLIGDYALPAIEAESYPTNTLSAKIADDFPTGKFLLRLRVDGAESFLQRDDDPDSPTYNKFIEPVIEVE